MYRFNFVQEKLLKWNICSCWFYLLELPTVRKPVESKQSIVRIRAQYSLVIFMGTIYAVNHFTKLWSTNFIQQSFFVTWYSFTKLWIPQIYLYFIIRFLSSYQNSYILYQVTLQFNWKAAYTQYKPYIVKSCTLVLNNSKIRYKDTIQVCFTSM